MSKDQKILFSTVVLLLFIVGGYLLFTTQEKAKYQQAFHQFTSTLLVEDTDSLSMIDNRNFNNGERIFNELTGEDSQEVITLINQIPSREIKDSPYYGMGEVQLEIEIGYYLYTVTYFQNTIYFNCRVFWSADEPKPDIPSGKDLYGNYSWSTKNPALVNFMAHYFD